MATIVPLETKRDSYVVALATGRSSGNELTDAGKVLGERFGVPNFEVKVEELDPNGQDGDRLIIVRPRYRY